MPTRPKKPCTQPGCAELSTTSHCAHHTPKRKRDTRPTSKARGYGRRWERSRKDFLKQPENAICAMCLKSDRTTPAVLVDHIIPHKGDDALFWDRDNWQGLCRPCHDEKSKLEQSGWLYGENMAKRSNTKVVVVYGPPGAGKSYHVTMNAKVGHLIWDFDEIIRAMSACDLHYRPKGFVSIAIYLRESLFQRLKMPNDISVAWIIATRMTESKRDIFIRDFVDPEFVVMETPKLECRRRMGGRITDELVGKIAQWWAQYKPHDADRVVRWS